MRLVCLASYRSEQLAIAIPNNAQGAYNAQGGTHNAQDAAEYI